MERADEDYPAPSYAVYVVGVLFLVWFFAYVDRQIIALLVPSLKASLFLSDTEVSLLQGIAFTSVFALAGLPLGRLADRSVRRNLIAFGVAFWSFATVACGLAGEFWELFAARMCVGFGEACIAPATVSLLADTFRPLQRGRAMGLVQVGAPLGTAGALFFGGLLLTGLTSGDLGWMIPDGWAAWQLIFVAAGAPGLLVAFLVLTLKEPIRKNRVRYAQMGAAPPRLWPLLRAQPAVFSVLFGLYGCFFIISAGTASWVPTILMRIYGYTPAAAGATYATVILVCSVGGYAAGGFISDALRKWRPLDGRMLIPALLLPIEIVAMIVFIEADGPWLTMAALAVSSISTGASVGTAYAALQDITPNQMRGQIIALYLLIAYLLGLGLAPTLVALVTDYFFSDEMMLQKSAGYVALVAATVAFILALYAPRLYRRARAVQDASVSG